MSSSSFFGNACANAKLAAITNEIASGSNTKIITNKSQLIILSIGVPVRPDKYCSGPNSLAVSLVFCRSKISNLKVCKLSAATCLCACTPLRFSSSTSIRFCDILNSVVEIVCLNPVDDVVSLTCIPDALALDRILIFSLILASSISYLLISSS